MPATTTKLKVGDGVAVLTDGDTFVVLWQEGVTKERWEWHRAHLEAARREAGSIPCLSLILPSSEQPAAPVRRTMQDDFRAMGKSLRRFVAVPLGDSLRMTLVRALIRSMLLLSGQSTQQGIAASVDEALEQLKGFAGPKSPSVTMLRAHIRSLCEALGLPSLTD
jgi:hypothetical protein